MARNTVEEATLKAEILERVRSLAALRAQQVAFEPGRTPVRYAGRVYDEAEMTNLVESALEFWLTGGRWHFKLEQGLADWYGVAAARLVNSGSSANLLAVASLCSHTLGDRRLQPHDEVITVAAGFPTTISPLIQHQLVPVFVDIALPTYNIDTAMLESARTSRTRAVMVAHTLGNPFELAKVVEFCRKYDLWLVEDNCDAAGATYDGRKTGTFGHLATLSFYPPHHMTTGEGGAVLINDQQLLRPLESIRDWGRDCWCVPGTDNTCGKRFEWQLGELPSGYDHKYVYSHLGYNLKLTDMQAAVGVAQLRKLDGFVRVRQENWAFFRDALAPAEDVLVLPDATENSIPSWFGFLMMVRAEAAFSRSDIVSFLESRKIQTRMLFAGNIVRQPAMTELVSAAAGRAEPPPFRVAGSLPNSDAVMTRGFWIGVYPGLSQAMLSYVADSILQFAKAGNRAVSV